VRATWPLPALYLLQMNLELNELERRVLGQLIVQRKSGMSVSQLVKRLQVSEAEVISACERLHALKLLHKHNDTPGKTPTLVLFLADGAEVIRALERECRERLKPGPRSRLSPLAARCAV
jgi:predicted transcriptional regulator